MPRFITDTKTDFSVIRGLIICSTISTLLLFGTIAPSFATVDLNAFFPIAGHAITPEFKFTKTVFIQYPNGGKLKDIFSGKNVTMDWTEGAQNNTSIKNFMQQLTTNFHVDRKSTASISNLDVHYIVRVDGSSSNHVSIDYIVTVTPTVTQYVMSSGGTNTPTVLDTSWIGWNFKGPVTVSTQNYGDLEINYPIDFIKNQFPDAYNLIKGTAAENVLSKNILDASPLLSQPLDKWDSLFDPAYTLAESAGFGFKGNKVAVTTYSMGVSSLQAGQMNVQKTDVDFKADTTYHLQTVEQPSSGTINVEGHSNPYQVQGEWAFSTTAEAAKGISNTTAGGMSTMIIYGMAGGAAAVGGIIFWMSNRRTKQVIHTVDTGPVQYETRKHWADKFDDEASGGPASSGSSDSSDDKPSKSAI